MYKSTRLLLILVTTGAVCVFVAPSAATAAKKYQTDVLQFGRFGYSDGSSATFPVTWFQYEVRVNTSSTCSDWDTCTGSSRDMGTFTWFTPIQVNIGSSKGDTDYALHGGLARGGSGWARESITSWYIDWSGYKASGPTLIDPITGWPHKAHNLRSLPTNRWYKIRVSRVSCKLQSGSSGYGWKMEAWHKPDKWWFYLGSAGVWCLPLSANTITSAWAFVEIIEPSPCNTDFNYVDLRNFHYKDASAWKYVDEADATYGGTAGADAQCTDTNWRRLTDTPGWMRNSRDQTRGAYGGLKISGKTGEVGAWDWWDTLTDVPRWDYYFPYIGTLREDNVVHGCTSTKFCPDNTLTRGQMAKVIVRGLGRSTTSYKGYFTDVPQSNIFWPYIERIKRDGITVGCNPPANTKYCPNSNVTRAQLATFLARATGVQGKAAKADHFTDDNSSVHHNNINLMRDRWIINGCGGTNFCPNSGVKREHMAMWLVRGFNLWQGSP